MMSQGKLFVMGGMLMLKAGSGHPTYRFRERVPGDQASTSEVRPVLCHTARNHFPVLEKVLLSGISGGSCQLHLGKHVRVPACVCMHVLPSSHSLLLLQILSQCEAAWRASYAIKS